jgi:hypothetical protein
LDTINHWSGASGRNHPAALLTCAWLATRPGERVILLFESAAADWKRAYFTNLDMDSDMWARTVSHSSKCSSPRNVNLYNLRAGPLPSTSHSEVTQSFCSSCRRVR